MNHTALKSSEEQKGNLLKLALFLIDAPEEIVKDEHHYRFDMYCFQITNFNACNSVYCAIGHGPLAGIARGEYEDWVSYARRVFTCSRVAHYWLFAGGWARVDNTKRGAALRIIYALQFGVPWHSNSSFYEDNLEEYEVLISQADRALQGMRGV